MTPQLTQPNTPPTIPTLAERLQSLLLVDVNSMSNTELDTHMTNIAALRSEVDVAAIASIEQMARLEAQIDISERYNVSPSTPTSESQPIEGLTLIQQGVLKVENINPKQILTDRPGPAAGTNGKAGIFSTSNLDTHIRHDDILKETSSPTDIHYTSYDTADPQPIDEIINKLGGIDQVKFWTMDAIAQLIHNQIQITGNTPNIKDPLQTERYNDNVFLVYGYKDTADKAANKKTSFALYARWDTTYRKWYLFANDLSIRLYTDDRVFLRN